MCYDLYNMEEKKPKYKSKRVMTPAIDSMSVKQERSCLSEIRSKAADIKSEHILENGWTAGNFALSYLMGQNKKRKEKNNNKTTL